MSKYRNNEEYFTPWQYPSQRFEHRIPNNSQFGKKVAQFRGAEKTTYFFGQDDVRKKTRHDVTQSRRDVRHNKTLDVSDDVVSEASESGESNEVDSLCSQGQGDEENHGRETRVYMVQEGE